MRRGIVLVAVIGSLVAAFFVVRLFAEFAWNPTVTIKFGEEFTEQNAYAADLLGQIVLSPDYGHDGKYFFSQAMDPFYLEPEVHAIYLDRPAYRAQRMLYPTVASLGGLTTPTVTAWGLIVVNIIAMGVGTAFTALVAVEMGISRWFGLAFVFNPGLIVAMNIDGAGIVATAALMAGVYYVMKDDILLAAMALTAASLARETMLIGAVGLALFWIRRHGRIPWLMSTPALAVGAWWLYLHWRLDEGLAQDTQALGLPFVGFAQAMQRWLQTPGSQIDLLMGSLFLIASITILIRARRTPSALAWSVAGFAFLGLLLSEPVWFRYFDSSRALAPVVTAYVLLVAASSSLRRDAADDAPAQAEDSAAPV